MVSKRDRIAGWVILVIAAAIAIPVAPMFHGRLPLPWGGVIHGSTWAIGTNLFLGVLVILALGWELADKLRRRGREVRS